MRDEPVVTAMHLDVPISTLMCSTGSLMTGLVIVHVVQFRPQESWGCCKKQQASFSSLDMDMVRRCRKGVLMRWTGLGCDLSKASRASSSCSRRMREDPTTKREIAVHIGPRAPSD